MFGQAFLDSLTNLHFISCSLYAISCLLQRKNGLKHCMNWLKSVILKVSSETKFSILYFPFSGLPIDPLRITPKTYTDACEEMKTVGLFFLISCPVFTGLMISKIKLLLKYVLIFLENFGPTLSLGYGT